MSQPDTTSTSTTTDFMLDARAGRAPLGRVELLLIFGFWTFMAVLNSANRVLDPRGRGLQPLAEAAPVAVAFLQSYLWAALTPFIFWLSSRYSLERSNWVARVMMFIVVGAMTAMAVDGISAYLRIEVFGMRGPGNIRFDALFGITRLFFLDDLVVFIAILAAGFARDYFLRFQARQREAVLLQAQTAQLQSQLADARLSALRTQLNPHFLFNTLNAVSALVERDPGGVRRMIARLSELLRYSLEGGEEHEVSLRQELSFLMRYIEIMQIRFQGRLEVDTRIDPATLGALVPNLILQPLVENAIMHGVNKVSGAGRIAIEASLDGDHLLLRVRDDGPGLGGDGASGTDGFGLRNTRERLAQLYGDDQRLSFRPADGGGLIAEISLPFHTGADLRASGQLVAQ